MTSEIEPSSESTDLSSSSEPTVITNNRNWFRSYGMPLLVFLICGAGLIYVNFFFDSLNGDAIVNLISLSLTLLMGLLLIIWFTFFSYVPRKTVILCLILLSATGLLWGASISSIEFDGDMKPVVHYRWEPDHRAKIQQAPTSVSQTESNDPEALLDQPFTILETDMPAYRGHRRDGLVTGPQLKQDWQNDPPEILWKSYVGDGYSAFSVVGNSALTLEQRDDQEAITCYDTKTGQLKWIYQYPSRFFEAMGGLGPRTTPTIEDGLVYTMGAQGVVCCLDFYTGELKWSQDLLETYQIPNIMWGLSSSPLIHQNLVIVNIGGPVGDGMLALDRLTGETIWIGEAINTFESTDAMENRAGYSSPTIEVIDGIEQILLFDGHGLSGHNIETGKRLWHYEMENNARVNVAQPVVLDDQQQIFVSTSYGNGSGLVKVTHQTAEDSELISWNVEEIWQNARSMRCKFTSPVYHQGYVYGLDEGILMCLDPLTGKKQWRAGRFGHGQILITNGQLLIMAENGDLVLVDANPERFTEITRMPVLTESVKVWNPHALVNGIAYVRDHLQMAAVNLRPN